MKKFHKVYINEALGYRILEDTYCLEYEIKASHTYCSMIAPKESLGKSNYVDNIFKEVFNHTPQNVLSN